MNTLFVGRKIIELNSVDSTNSYANDLLKKENLPEGTIIITKSQIRGRGQRGNLWKSEPFKNLTFSLILQPLFLSVSQQFYLNKIISLAVSDFVSAILKKNEKKDTIKIKWPNDIYVNDQKIAGILIENSIRGSQIVSVVVGIGININQTYFNNLPNPTSLKCICNQSFDLEKCLFELCSFIESRYFQLKSNTLYKLDEDYKQILYRYGYWANFKIGKKKIKARIINVSSDGKLILETSDETQISCGFKEIEFIF